MKTKIFARMFAVALLVGWAGAANAASVTLTPDATTISVGDSVTFTYTMDFTDEATIGGGTDFWYDPTILTFVGWSFDAGFTADDPFYRRNPDDCTSSGDAGCSPQPNDFPGAGSAQINGMAFGNFDGISGPAIVGQLLFTAVGEGVATINMNANDDGPAGNPGPFVSDNTFAEMQVTFNPGTVEVTAQVVPVPAAAWLMMSGLGMLGGLRRFGKSNG